MSTSRHDRFHGPAGRGPANAAPGRPRLAAAEHPLVWLQRTAGNQAVRRLVQHDAGPPATPASETADPEHLGAPELAGADFDAAYHNDPPLGVSDSRWDAVVRLQTLLGDRFGLRAGMPRTFAAGLADGKWGDETTAAVRSFQTHNGVLPVGGWEAGHRTLRAMDRALTGAGPRPIPPSPLPVPTTPEIHLVPPTGPEAGPREHLGDVPYSLRVEGSGFASATPLLVTFADEAPIHAVAGPEGVVSREIRAARRARGTYRVTARGATVEAAAEFRVIPTGDESDPRREQLYAHYLREATRMLRDAEFGAPLSSDFDHDRFDHEFWDWGPDATFPRVLLLKRGKRPSQAIDALFARLTAWRVDCDHTVQIANLYAQRMVLGADLFDHRQGLTLTLRPRGSTGLTTRQHWGRMSRGDPWRIVHAFRPPNTFVFASGPPVPDTTEALVARAPVGSRVRFTNLVADDSEPFKHENAIKLNSDKFVGGGFDDPVTGNEFTREELEILMARKTLPRPSRDYVRYVIYIDEVEVFDRA